MHGLWFILAVTLTLVDDVTARSGRRRNVKVKPGDAACSVTLDVAVVGAGPTGAYSAYRLRDLGKRIGMFEYSDRVGGRTYDYKLPNTPDVLLALGAMRYIPGDMPRLEKILDELDLKTYNFTMGFGRVGMTRYFLRGGSYTKHDVKYGDVPYALTELEKENQAHLFEYYLQKLVPEYKGGSATRKELMRFKVKDGRYLYQLTFDEAMGLVASSEGLAFIKDVAVLKDDMAGQVSSIVMLHDHLGADWKGSEVRGVVEGMMGVTSSLVSNFTKSSRDHFLKKNMQLKAIQKKGLNQYVLEFLPTVTHLGETRVMDFKTPQKVCANQIILALPVFALRQVQWAQLLDDRVEQAYNALMTPPSSKVFMTFESQWWLNYYDDAYVVFGDEKLQGNAMYTWTKSEVSGDYIMISSYADGNSTSVLKFAQGNNPSIAGSESGAHRVTKKMSKLILDPLARAVHVAKDQVPKPKTSVAQFWTDYPFGCGWTKIKAGYDFDELMRVQRRPSITDDVFVVGSDYAWGVLVGWIEGGLETVDTVIDEYFL